MNSPLILGIDTTQQVASIALSDEEKIYAEYTIYNYKQQVKNLIPYIKRLFEDVNIELNKIDCIAVTKGPGSFTGIKIGLITAKTLAYTLNKKIVAISTLEALAYNLIYTNYLICPIIDAKKNQLYTALFKSTENRLEKLTTEVAIPIEELIKLLNNYPDEKIVFLGDGIKKYQTELNNNIKNVIFLPHTFWQVRAINICQIAQERIKNNQLDDPLTLLPQYLRDIEIEILKK